MAIAIPTELTSLQSDNLNSSLKLSPISPSTKRTISDSLWGCSNQVQQGVGGCGNLDAYFRYYTTQSDLFEPGRKSWATTHQDINTIVSLLRQQNLKRDEARHSLRARLQPHPQSYHDSLLDGAINLAIRLLLMMKVGDPSGPNYFSACRMLAWEQGPTLREFVAAEFVSAGTFASERVKFDKFFTAKNFSRLAGINIYWTNNFANHLRLLNNDAEVAIFHHAAFLEFVRTSDFYPPGLIDETVRTLTLLFPSTDETRKWFKKLAPGETVNAGVINCGRLSPEHRHIDAFAFWRDLLVVLKQMFDEKEPTTWFQWWQDRRRGLQSYPFLLAAIALILTLFIGLVQCLVGAMQVYKAYHPS